MHTRRESVRNVAPSCENFHSSAGLNKERQLPRASEHLPHHTMSRTSKLFTSAANAIQAITPELQAGAQPTFRHWAANTLRAYPARLEADMQGASRLKSFSNWTGRDLRNAFVLTGNFALFFFLGEAFGRGIDKTNHHALIDTTF